MPALTDAGYIRAVLGKHGFHFSKGLGQNFLINPSVCPRMAEACDLDKDSAALEIGPGFGVLTKELAERAGKVVALEVDERLPAVLAETLAEYDNVELVMQDVLKADLPALLNEKCGGKKVAVCANLPYYITSPVIMCLLEQRLPVSCITVMVQKEAAQRLCAKPGTRECGAVSLAVQYYAEAETLFSVSRGSFMPAPNVDSAVIRLTPKSELPLSGDTERRLFALIKAAFGKRRKTLQNALQDTGLSREQVTAMLEACGVPVTTRAEQLTLEQFIELAKAYPEA